jgi:regulatory protein
VSADPYLAALRMLAGRELSEAQVRQRLARRRHDPDAVDAAIARLKAERSLDDERVAGAIARREAGLRKRAARRVEQAIERAGIARPIAQRAVADAFEAIDGDELLAAALDRRLRGRVVRDDRERHRLYRYLLAQGFDPDRVHAALRKRSSRSG